MNVTIDETLFAMVTAQFSKRIWEIWRDGSEGYGFGRTLQEVGNPFGKVECLARFRGLMPNRGQTPSGREFLSRRSKGGYGYHGKPFQYQDALDNKYRCFPGGVGSESERMGSRLSGGEKQRARAWRAMSPRRSYPPGCSCGG
jgi:hypothetical protein